MRASAGSLFHLPVVRAADPVALVGVLAGAGLSALATTGTATADLDTAGTEGDPGPAHRAAVRLPGPRFAAGRVAALADESVRVPIYGRAESLNPAAAATCHTPAPVRTGGHLTERETSGT